MPADFLLCCAYARYGKVKWAIVEGSSGSKRCLSLHHALDSENSVRRYDCSELLGMTGLPSASTEPGNKDVQTDTLGPGFASACANHTSNITSQMKHSRGPACGVY